MATTTRQGRMETLRLSLSKDIVLRLFENDLLPDYYNTIESFKEIRGGDYKPKVLSSGKWKYGFVADVPIATYPDQIFEFTGAVGLIYGYYITDRDNKIVRWAEKFADGPYEVLRNGDKVTVNPRARLPLVDKPKKR
jgi:hypothetical protein